MARERNERLETVEALVDNLHSMQDEVSEEMRKTLETYLNLWFPASIPEYASLDDVTFVSEGLVTINWESFKYGMLYVRSLSHVIAPFILRIWNWLRFIWKTDSAREIYAIYKRDILTDLVRFVAFLGMSQELAGAMQNVPGLLDDIAQIWSGKHYRVPSAHMADARSFRAEIVVFSSLAIQRILFMQNFESSFNDAATMKFINAVGGPKEVATIYLRGLDEIFQGKAFLQEFLLKPVSSRSTESLSSHLLGLLPFILILRPISNVLYQESIVPKIVDHISTLIDIVSPGSEVDMVTFFKSLTFALFLSGAESKHQLIDALADESNGQGGLLGLLWRTKFDETKEFCRKTVLLLFKGLCNHLFWVQTITPSLEAITLVEEEYGEKIQGIAETSLLKRLWTHYVALVKKYASLKSHWLDNALEYCMELTCNFRLPAGNMTRCGGCKLATYCSKECQAKNWKEHKKLCKKMQSYKTAGFRVEGRSDAVSFSKECWKIDMCNPEIYTALHNLIYNVLLTSPPAFQHPEHVVVVEMDYVQVPVNVTAKWAPIPHKDTMHPDIKNASQWAMIKKQYQCNGISSPYTELSVVVAVKVTTWFGKFNDRDYFTMTPLEPVEDGLCFCGCGKTVQSMRSAFSTPIPGLHELGPMDEICVGNLSGINVGRDEK